MRLLIIIQYKQYQLNHISIGMNIVINIKRREFEHTNLNYHQNIQ